MDISVEVEHIRLGVFKVLDIAPPAHFSVTYSNGIFTVDNNKYGISVSSENLQKIIDEIVRQLKSLMVEK
jgi:hypothetical protein